MHLPLLAHCLCPPLHAKNNRRENWLKETGNSRSELRTSDLNLSHSSSLHMAKQLTLSSSDLGHYLLGMKPPSCAQLRWGGRGGCSRLLCNREVVPRPELHDSESHLLLSGGNIYFYWLDSGGKIIKQNLLFHFPRGTKACGQVCEKPEL